MRRCYDINHESYPNYGGRGIIVCPEWKNNPTAFIEWGIKNGFAKELEIDREDNDGNYEPDNCRFITRPQNCLNKRGTVYANYRGQTKPIKEWSIILNIPYTRLYSRIKSGWNAIDAIEMPVNEKLATYKKPPARMQRAKTNVSERVNPADALYNIHLHSPS